MSGKDITWPEGCKFCHWKGVEMTPDYCKKYFGIEHGDYLEGKHFVILGSTLFCSNFKSFLREIAEHDDTDWLKTIEDVKSFEYLKKIKYKEFMEFANDLDDYYSKDKFGILW